MNRTEKREKEEKEALARVTREMLDFHDDSNEIAWSREKTGICKDQFYVLYNQIYFLISFTSDLNIYW